MFKFVGQSRCISEGSVKVHAVEEGREGKGGTHVLRRTAPVSHGGKFGPVFLH